MYVIYGGNVSQQTPFNDDLQTTDEQNLRLYRARGAVDRYSQKGFGETYSTTGSPSLHYRDGE